MRFVILALFVAAASATQMAPLFKAQQGDAVPNSFMVKLKAGTDIQAFNKKIENSQTFVTKTYKTVFYGVAVTAFGKDVSVLRTFPEVEYIEEDMIMTADVEWGCDRLDQTNLPLDGRMDIYGKGEGAHVFIADTGLRYTHQEFAHRAFFLYDFTSGGDGEDCHGHGTHCGGTATGRALNGGVGVARGADVHAVRVLNCQGSGLTSNIVAGLEAIKNSGLRPGVCSMSIGGGASNALDDGVRDLIAAGVPTAVSAGNSNADACNQSPARTPEAETVGSTTSSDARSSFSNYGTCVDVFAGGSSVYSSYHLSDSSYTTMSGTSMSCPHVAGVLAVHLASGQCSTGADCKSKIAGDATRGVISNPGNGSPNLLLYCD
ncbi:aqualysin-1-like [Glandiceps talaboti]